jgi:hypothetical protein
MSPTHRHIFTYLLRKYKSKCPKLWSFEQKGNILMMTSMKYMTISGRHFFHFLQLYINLLVYKLKFIVNIYSFLNTFNFTNRVFRSCHSSFIFLELEKKINLTTIFSTWKSNKFYFSKPSKPRFWTEAFPTFRGL